jgi:hypothetical protein
MTLGRILASLLLAGSLAMAGGTLLPTPQRAGVGAPADAAQDLDDYNAPYDGRYHFFRVRYSVGDRGFGGFGRRGRREPPWGHDYPRAERNFLSIVDETTFIGPLTDGSNILALDDPRIYQYPIAYIVEVGAWNPTDAEVEGLGQYLRKGGFLIVDDFGTEWELGNLQLHMDRAVPGAKLTLLDETHDIFDSFFRINPALVVPPYTRGRGPPLFYGIYEDNDPKKRLLAIVNYNNDIAEYWEFSDRGYYPIDLSNEAYKLGVNYLVYAMTH